MQEINTGFNFYFYTHQTIYHKNVLPLPFARNCISYFKFAFPLLGLDWDSFHVFQEPIVFLLLFFSLYFVHIPILFILIFLMSWFLFLMELDKHKK